MAVAAVDTQLYVDGVWTSYPSLEGESCTVNIGSDVETGTSSNKVSFTLQSDDLSMDPSNPASALFGKIGRNTPARVRVSSNTLATCEASAWAPDRTVEHSPGTGRGLSWVALTAEGLLRRIGRWEDNLDSPMARQLGSYSSLLGYWPCEGGSSDTTRLSEASGVAGATYGTISGTVTMQGDPGPGGSDSVLTVGSDGAIGGRFARSFNSGWQMVFHARLPAVPGSATYGTMIQLRLSNGNKVEWQVNSTTFRILITAHDGTNLLTTVVGFGTGVDITKWLRYRLKVSVSGGTVSVEPAWYAQDSATVWGATDTYAATSTGALLTWSTVLNTYMVDGGYSHIFAVTDTSLNLTTSYEITASFNGYPGEAAANRFLRLLSEQGLSGTVMGTADNTVPMGRQKPDTLLAMLEECARTDDALIYDDPSAISLVFRTRRHRQDQTVKLALVKTTNVAPPLVAVIDDSEIVNDVTITNYNGSEARAQLIAGVVSVLPPPAGVGRYRKSITVRQRWDETLDDRGSWELNKGTIDRRRYKRITVDLLSNPSLIPTIAAMRPGDLITLAGADPDTVRLHVLSYEWTILGFPVTVVLNCIPADVWSIGIYDDAGSAYDSGSTILVGSMTSSATTVKIGSSLAEFWSTTATPFDIAVTGERMTVTAMGATTTDATLSANGFESNASGWDAVSCTIAQSATFAHTGSFSGLMTVVGSPGQAYIRKTLTQCPRVVPGQSYKLSVWVRSAALLTDVRGTIDWYDAAGVYLSTSDSGAASLASGSWVERTVTVDAPAGAAYAQYGATIAASPTAGTVLYTDDLLVTSTTQLYQTATVTRSVNGVVKAHTAGESFSLADPVRYDYF